MIFYENKDTAKLAWFLKNKNQKMRTYSTNLHGIEAMLDKSLDAVVLGLLQHLV